MKQKDFFSAIGRIRSTPSQQKHQAHHADILAVLCIKFPTFVVVGLGLAIRLDAVYEQGSHGKGNPYPHHACPSIMLPGQARNESSGRTTQEINGHINGIDTVDGRCVKGYYAGLIRQWMHCIPASISKMAIIIHK